MKLVTYKKNNTITIGTLHNNKVYDLNQSDDTIPNNMIDFISNLDINIQKASNVVNNGKGFDLEEAKILSPILNPPSVKDGYAFRQHVATARRNRGLEMIPEFDEIPIFYFTNHHAIYGQGDFEVLNDHLDKLDFELECAAVIGKKGRNVSASEADNYIAGFMIMNDLSARGMQMKEMKLNLGPAKGKDFGSTFGPFLVTKDELEEFKISSPEGDRYNLKMKAFVNDIQVSEDTLSNMNWTFAQIIERVSYGADIFPGDIIGSGTCGTGCFLELNGSKITNNQWLEPGDKVSLDIEQLGTLTNTIVLNNS